MDKPYVIAEIGVNFYDTAKIENISLIDAAKKYILAAKDAKVNAVKFQAYKADTLASKNSPAYWDTTKETTLSQYELFKKFDKLTKQDYIELYNFCKSVSIDFMATPFDIESADFLNEMVNVYKISSSDLNNLSFIEHIAKKGKPIMLSVGASYLSEVEEAVRTIRKYNDKELCLMHCVLSYPCKNEDANLNFIKTLKHIFPKLSIGYSDHTLPDPNMIILTTAYLFGANVIEKHFTLDKSLKGNDHYHAGDPSDFKKFYDNIKLLEQICGQDEKKVLSCEEVSRKQARRSIIINRNMKSGDIIDFSDLIMKRPGTGVEPKFAEIIIGKKIKKDIEADSVFTWDMII